jgi:hypothetical protein
LGWNFEPRKNLKKMKKLLLFNITKATLANNIDSNRGSDNKFQIPPLTCEGGAGGRGLRLSADGWR